MVVLAIALAACGPDGASSTPAVSPAGSVSTVTSPPDASPPPSAGDPVGQTDTDWGRIWDDLPPGFPSIPGSTPGEGSATGPASADLVVEGGVAKDIVTGLRSRLEQAGYSAIGEAGPLEDGGYVLDMTGPPSGCQIQVRVAPLGGLTSVTILYGAACPFG